MPNALEIYNRLNFHSDITGLIGTQEDIFIDFKMTSATDGTPSNDDKHNLKEAISGFSNQEGGVLIWGINCRTNPDTGVDEAIEEKPLAEVGDFQKKLGDFFPYTTEPLIDGILTKLIFVGDDSSAKKGFLLYYIPRSYKVGRILNPKKSVLFYKRYGAQFRPVETSEEIKSLFFRQTSPEFEVIVNTHQDNRNDLSVTFTIKNKSQISAKSVSVFTSTPSGVFSQYYDGGGNDRWDQWTKAVTGNGSKTFLLNSGCMLHPDQSSVIFSAHGHFPPGTPRPEILECVVYAENSIPLKGRKELPQ